MQEITAEMLLNAYASGYFPMAESANSEEIQWFYPETRGIIPLDGFHTPASLAKFLRKNPFTYTTNRAFREVMTACAERNKDTWINDKIIQLYCQLHEMGFAHSVECWLKKTSPACGGGGKSEQAVLAGFTVGENQTFSIPPCSPPASGGTYRLAGGLYGVSLGGAFFGESMFSRTANASKAALVHLVSLLNQAGYTLLDCQYVNDHLKQFGIIEIPREEYLQRLQSALTKHPKNLWAEKGGQQADQP